ncbi:MAG: hypothetical protein DRO40_13085 [Thermoprotei archaeon]|nr:MAG: hypothetical protein DRO40_13085 [Thermoprotei archaeon]
MNENHIREAGKIAENLFKMVDTLYDVVKEVASLFFASEEEIFRSIYEKVNLKESTFRVKENLIITQMVYSKLPYTPSGSARAPGLMFQVNIGKHLVIMVDIFEKGEIIHASGHEFWTKLNEETKPIHDIVMRLPLRNYLEPLDRVSEKTLEKLDEIRKMFPEKSRIVEKLTGIEKIPYRLLSGKRVDEKEAYRILKPMEFSFKPRKFTTISMWIGDTLGGEIDVYNDFIDVKGTISVAIIEKIHEIMRTIGTSVAKTVIRAVEEKIVEVK